MDVTSEMYEAAKLAWHERAMEEVPRMLTWQEILDVVLPAAMAKAPDSSS